MSQPSPLSIDNILRFLQVRGNGASFYEIQRGLHLRKSDHRPLMKMLAKLKKKEYFCRWPFRAVLREPGAGDKLADLPAEAVQNPPGAGNLKSGIITGRLICTRTAMGFVPGPAHAAT
jgi:hypothetical protein